MKLSNKQKSLLYESISEPIMKFRINLGINRYDKDLDYKLFKLNQEIWKEVQKQLKFKE